MVRRIRRRKQHRPPRLPAGSERPAPTLQVECSAEATGLRFKGSDDVELSARQNAEQSKTDNLSAPFPYFGGKHRVAPLVWAALGDPHLYIEPFFGSGAVLLARPLAADFPGRRLEIVNDADGFVANL